MYTLSVDFSSVGVTLLFLIVSLIAGIAVGVAEKVLGIFGAVAVGVASAIAGSRRGIDSRSGGALAVSIRAVLYAIASFAALILSASGYAKSGNLLGVLAAFCLGLAGVRLLSRL